MIVGTNIGPFLITLRVANQRALTSDTVVSENIGLIHFWSQKTTGASATLPDGCPVTSINSNAKTPGGPGRQ